ncbi:MAG TPA: HEAT repeat domain-containing protein [Candidatus Rifleibacterium sp.]|nr:HEAT repeat domain-containing protein [Candidatus Rifleibacterium sp.]HPT47124.1 HEAT repeat domain-containing protein [Candidatus Rifleibacterium sp.]
MNSILMIVIVVVIFLLVFVMFSLDDHEEEGFPGDDNSEQKTAGQASAVEQSADSLTQPGEVTGPPETQKPHKEKSGDRPPEKAPEKGSVRQISRLEAHDRLQLVESGTEEDLRFRIKLDQRLPLPVSAEDLQAVVMSVQLRFPEDVLSDGDTFLKLMHRAESVLEKEFSFPFSSYSGSQLDRIWVFGRDEDRDDPLFEALVVGFEVISRFKKTLETDSVLRESKARIAVGLSMGRMLKINRGIASMPSWVGKPAYLAETLAEAAIDFSIYVDEQIHKAALPLFDFREWKPVKLRLLPAIPFYELIGWNDAEEISAFTASKDPGARRAVAVAFRYLNLDDKIQPLVELLSDPDERVAMEALETLKVIGSANSLGLLKRMLPETQDPTFRSAIIDAFAAIGSNEVVPVVLGSTKEANWKVRLSAARALHKLAGNEALRHLEPMLNDVDGSVKAAVNGVFFRETAQKQYVENLTELLGDLSKRTRKVAAEELLAIETDSTVKIVINAFAEQDADLQKLILRKLETSRSKILYQCFLTLFKNSGEKIRPFIVDAVRRAGLVS